MKRCEKCGAKFPVCGSRVFGKKYIEDEYASVEI